MHMYDLIFKKRQGGSLTDEEIRFLIQAYIKDEIPDYQMSALMMAIFFQGLDERETITLTLEMAASGDQVDLSRFGSRTADKHSTGGVGDKTTLITAPIAAACGVIVAKMSGRGLGHTGGTVDKLESIPGFCTEMEPSDFFHTVQHTGIAVVGQSGNLAPADKKLYALRDVTATVENHSLIASSIMSKKLAAGAKNIVLDVKYGSGAFMKTPEDAAKLAHTMVSIGNNAGRNTAAVLTNMDLPLGYNIGNALEVREAIETLKGSGPDDLTTVCLVLGAKMIELSLGKSPEEAYAMAQKALNSGAALAKFIEMVKAQGGDASYIEHPEKFEPATYSFPIKAKQSGYICALNAEQMGLASVYLGAGRQEKEDTIDYSAGIILYKKPGDAVHIGDVLANLYTKQPHADAALALAQQSYIIGQKKPKDVQLIYGVIE